MDREIALHLTFVLGSWQSHDGTVIEIIINCKVLWRVIYINVDTRF